jgi:hypothetical protein
VDFGALLYRRRERVSIEAAGIKRSFTVTRGVTESQFYMWRTLFAIAHADDVVTDEEKKFMDEAIRDIPFSVEQKQTLRGDIETAQDIGKMFKSITDKQDQARFFRFAQQLVWVDGDYGPEEQKIMLQLQTEHIKGTNVDELVGSVELELDDDARNWTRIPPKQRSTKTIIHSFREDFLRNRFGNVAE